MDKIQSKKYFNAVKTYSSGNDDPAIIYRFLMDLLQTDKHIPYEEMLYRHVDTFEATDNCMHFYTGTECTLAICSQQKKTEI